MTNPRGVRASTVNGRGVAKTFVLNAPLGSATGARDTTAHRNHLGVYDGGDEPNGDALFFTSTNAELHGGYLARKIGLRDTKRFVHGLTLAVRFRLNALTPTGQNQHLAYLLGPVASTEPPTDEFVRLFYAGNYQRVVAESYRGGSSLAFVVGSTPQPPIVSPNPAQLNAWHVAIMRVDPSSAQLSLRLDGVNYYAELPGWAPFDNVALFAGGRKRFPTDDVVARLDGGISNLILSTTVWDDEVALAYEKGEL